MSLTIEIDGGHFRVSDGCRATDEYLREKYGERASEFLDRDYYVFDESIGVAHAEFKDGRNMKVECGICHREYILTKEDFEKAEEAYKKLTASLD